MATKTKSLGIQKIKTAKLPTIKDFKMIKAKGNVAHKGGRGK